MKLRGQASGALRDLEAESEDEEVEEETAADSPR